MNNGPYSKSGRNVPADFLPLARHLRKWQDTDPEYMPVVAALDGIGRRTAYALARIDRVFGHLPVSREQLLQIGWSKLAILAPYVDDANYQELLDLAEEVTSWELETLLRGGEVSAGTRCMILRLSPDQFDIVEQVLLKYGALRSGRGLVGKESALVNAFSKVLDGQK